MKRNAVEVLCFFVMCVMFCAVGDAALAQTDNTGVYTLGEVVVSAPMEGAKAIETEKTVTAKDIKERGARTLDEALELVPGLVIRAGADGIPRVDIRGFRTRHVLLLLNGTPFNSTYDGQFDPSAISVENIAKIEVITGGTSILYGPGGNGGVINIITKKGKPGIHGSLGGEGGEGNEYLGRGSISGGSDKVNAFVSGSTYGREGYFLSDDFSPTPYQAAGLRNNSDLHRDNVFANVGYSPSDKTSIGLTYSYIQDTHGIPPVDNYNPNDPFRSNLKYDRIDGSTNNVVQFAMSQDLGGPFSLKAWGYYNQLNMLENLYDDESYTTQDKKGSSSTDSTTGIAGGNVQLRGDFKKWGTVTLGFMPENDAWDAVGFKVIQVKQNNKSHLVKQYFDADHSFQVYSALFQYEVCPIKHLGFVAGLGLHEQDREGGSKQDYSYLIGAYYDLFKGTRLRVSHARRIKFPTLRDLYDPNSGNPSLNTESTYHYEAGVEQDLPAKTMLSVTGFVINAHNFIEKDVNNISQNFDKYRFRGFEVSVDNRFIQNLFVNMSYSYLNSKNESPGIHTDELQYRPRDKVTIEGNYRFPTGTSINASLLYLANQYDLSHNNLSAKRMPSYTVVDVKLNQSLMNNALDLYIGVRNLFDENYYENYGFPLAGRTIYGGIGYRF